MIQKFEFREAEIKGLFEITPFNADDIRGCFTKDYSREIFEQNGIEHEIAEVFYSTSKKGVIRGLHFQRVKEQAKLVRCISGHIFDVVVDLRAGSPTFKKWLGFELNEENCKEVLVPVGCAHGFLALNLATVSYKCSECFCAEGDDGMRWNDPDIAIDWGLERIGGVDKVILSEKDSKLQSLKEFTEKYGGF
ncbi:MAG: dTDP-4-dehydrorhamnose 3,5-epimerase [Oscillospiraceae bacterium]|nr:dTDP-4-dehydrorhamnose 3,5-epimerase [Oscillospiraceae bacterium]